MFRFYSKHAHGRITIVADVKDGILRLSAAKCRKKDKFVRKLGATIALGRHQKEKFCETFPIEEPLNGKEFVKIASGYAEHLYNHPSEVCS